MVIGRCLLRRRSTTKSNTWTHRPNERIATVGPESIHSMYPTMHIYASGVDGAEDGDKATKAANKIGAVVKKYANLRVRNDRKSKWKKGKRTAKVYGPNAARRSPAASAQLALQSFVASQEQEDNEELFEDELDDVLASVPVFGNGAGTCGADGA